MKGIIEVTANQIYSGWDYSVTMPKEKINSVIKNKVKEKKFFAYGFGAAIELDLTRSSELKKTVNPAIMFSYERSIEDANSFLQNKLEEIENKFVTRNQSGGSLRIAQKRLERKIRVSQIQYLAGQGVHFEYSLPIVAIKPRNCSKP